MNDSLTPQQCRTARAWLDWTQADLADKANVGISTVADFERGTRTRTTESVKVSMMRAFINAGVLVLPNGVVSGKIALQSVKRA